MQVQAAQIVGDPLDDRAVAVRRHQDTVDRVTAVIIGHHHHRRAGRQAGRVGVVMRGEIARFGGARDGQGFRPGHVLASTVADGVQAITPGGHAVEAGQQGAGEMRGEPAQEPHIHVRGDVDQARRLAGEEVAARGQGALDPGGVRPPLAAHGDGGGLHRRDVEGAAGQLFPILDEIGRHVVAQFAEDHRDRGLEEQAVGPQIDHPIDTAKGRGAG